MKINSLLGIGGLLTILVASLFVLPLVAALPVTIIEVEVDDTELVTNHINVLDVERTDELEVKVVFNSTANLSNVQVEANLRGYDHDDLIEDITDVFDVKSDVTYSKTLNLKLPVRMDQDRYTLRIYITDRSGEATVEESYQLEVDTPRHFVDIEEVMLSPENEVMAGRSLLVTVRVENFGETDEEGIRIKASIPELGVSATDYLDEIEAEDSTSSEELYLRIPACAEEGDYDVLVDVTYDDGDEKVYAEQSISVLADEELCEGEAPEDEEDEEEEQPGRTILSVPERQQVEQGKGVVYPIVITNTARNAETYTLSVSGVESFGTYSLDPSNVVVVQGGATESVYLYITVNDDATVGDHVFNVKIAYDEASETVGLTATVVQGTPVAADGSWEKVKRGLEIALIILVVLLVIIGLIIGFNKLRGTDDEEEEREGSEKTYY